MKGEAVFSLTNPCLKYYWPFSSVHIRCNSWRLYHSNVSSLSGRTIREKRNLFRVSPLQVARDGRRNSTRCTVIFYLPYISIRHMRNYALAADETLACFIDLVEI
jgi:hypothetical protein